MRGGALGMYPGHGEGLRQNRRQTEHLRMGTFFQIF